MPVEAVMDVVMFWQPTPEAVAFVCAELDAGRMPPSNNGVEVPQLFEVPPWGGRCGWGQWWSSLGLAVLALLKISPCHLVGDTQAARECLPLLCC